jgi:hypothetical protein
VVKLVRRGRIQPVRRLYVTGVFEMGTSGPTRGPGKTAAAQGKNISPAQGAQEAERRLGKPCYHAGQKVPGIYACVTCQFRINNRGTLPACPDCGEIIWAYMGDGPRPVPEGETAAPAPEAAPAAAVQDDVPLQPTAQEPVKVEEGIKLEP